MSNTQKISANFSRPESPELCESKALPGVHAITIENFKGFGAPVTIPLRPATLLFGPNSAGKSTVIQALQYASEVFQNFNANIDKTCYGGEHVSLRGFRNMVHQHDLSREIGLTIHFYGKVDLDEFVTNKDTFMSFGGHHAFDPDSVDLGGLLQGFYGEHWAVRVGIRYGDWIKKAYISTYSIELNCEPLCHMGHGLNLYLNAKHPAFKDATEWEKLWPERKFILDALLSNHANDYRGIGVSYEDYARIHPEVAALYWRREYRPDVDCSISSSYASRDPNQVTSSSANVNDVQYLGRERRGWTSRSIYSFRAHTEVWDRNLGVELCQNQDELAYDEQFIVSVFEDEGAAFEPANARLSEEYRDNKDAIACILTQLVKAPVKTVSDILKSQAYLGPFRKKPYRVYQELEQDQAGALWSEGAAAWELLRGKGEMIEVLNRHIIETLGLPYELVMEESILISREGDFNQRLKRFLAEMKVADINTVDVDSLQEVLSTDTIHRIKLRDIASGTLLELSDVGIGVTQILPVLIGLVLDRSTIFAVEQPELHLHPAAQSKLGDLIINAIKMKQYPGYRRCILETHSEHMILRILRRIRESSSGELPSGFPSVGPKAFQVVYLDKNESGETTAHTLEITSNGDFVGRWPNGFFEERDEDLF